MANIINATTVGAGGISYTADASGVLQLQANGTTALTVGAGGLLTAANGLLMSSMTLGTATAGEFEYDGQVPYFTPLGTQRGVIPGMQYYRLNSNLVGLNATGNQKLLGVGVTLSSNTFYAFECYTVSLKEAGTTSHTFGINWATTGTMALESVYNVLYVNDGSLVNSSVYGNRNATMNNVVITPAITTAVELITLVQKGTVSVTVGGTLTPQYYLSAAPGGAYTTLPGGYMYIYPIGVTGANTSVGTWA